MSSNMTDLQSISARIVADASRTEEGVDGLGRKIVVRRLNVFDQARLARAVGAESSGNPEFMKIATCAAMIASVDDMPRAFPKTSAEVDAAINVMGDAAYLIVMSKLVRWTMESSAAMDEDFRKAFEDRVKNSSGTPESASESGS